MYGRRQWWARAGALAAATALHAVFVAPFVLGMSARRHPAIPDMQGAGASALRSTAQAPTSMTLVDLSSAQDADEPPLEDLASLGIELPKTDLIIASTDPNPAFTPLEVDETPDSDTTQAAGDTQGQAAMFGRYLGQVSARIERAWMRPRNAIDAPRFSCETKIEQDRDGRVLSVELRQCNGDVGWQRSLVNAIQRASPLPAPPVPTVFTNVLILDFSAESYRAGLSRESEYEPNVRTASTPAASHATTNSPEPFESLPRRRQVDLRIEGRTVIWSVREKQQVVDSGASSAVPDASASSQSLLSQ